MAETKRILVVDDEPTIAFFLAENLATLNPAFEIETAHTGEEAMDNLASGHFDLVVTDLRLPGISGLELIRWLRASSPQTRTVLITAHGSPKIEREAAQLQVHQYITKPFDMEVFLREAQEALAPSEEDRASTDQQHIRDVAISLAFHELRVPLTHIMAHAGLLTEECKGACRESAEEIVNHTLRMREALDDFTLLTEWSVGHLPGYLEQVDLQRALETIAAQLASLAIARHQTIEVQPPLQPIRIITDAWLLRTLLTALVSNAVKHAPPGAHTSIGAAQESQKVTVTVKAESNEAVAGQDDSDPGVLVKVTRELARALGGDLEFQSEAGGRLVSSLSFSLGRHSLGEAESREMASVEAKTVDVLLEARPQLLAG